MAKLQHTFVRGRMNKDLDERLVPNGEYRDAVNIQVSTSEGSDVGAVENILGNTIKNFEGSGDWDDNFGLSNVVCIGTVRDSQNEKIYWFITSDSIDAIMEFDQPSGIVSPVLVDTNNVLNFSGDYLITGVNILEGLLYWTDDLNEPKVINIDTFKAGSAQGSNVLSVHTQVYGRNFVEKDTTVITETPGSAPRARAFASLIGGDGTGLSTITTNTTSTFYGKTGGDVVSLAWTASGSQLNWPANSRVILKSRVPQSDGGETLYQVIGVFASLVPNAVGGSLTIETITLGIPGTFLEWDMLLIEDDPIFKNDFPRFSYRYKYTDGRYSTYAPFSDPAFVPGEFKYLSRDGNNEGMSGLTRKLTIDNLPTTPDNVVEVEILYKGASDNNVYVIETFEAGSVTSLDITSSTLGPVVESLQILRLFDNVPRKAKSQETVANRIVYGNYLQGYDVVPSSVVVQSSEYSNAHTNVGFGLPSVKTDREYQVGVSFLDDYGRESPIFTSSTGAVTFNKKNAEKVNSIEATLIAGSAPDWATYFKFYIKNSTPEYYNLALDRYYDAEDGGVWLSFPSSERNKLQEGQYVTLKKQHDSSTPVLFDNKYKALNISNEAPDYIASVETALARAQTFAFDSTSFSKFAVGSNRAYFYGPNGVTPDKNDGQPASGSNLAFYSNIKQGNFIQFASSTGDGKSASYAIAQGGPTGATINLNGKVYSEYEIILAEDLKGSDAWLASLATEAEFRATVFEKQRRALPEFDGRFFVKINPNSSFFDNVYAAFSDLANAFVEDIQLSIRAIAGSTIPSGDTDVYWDDSESVTAIQVLPGSIPSNRNIFRIFTVRTDGTPGEVADQVDFKLTLGSKIKFSYTDGSLSPAFYNIIDRTHYNYNRTIGNGDGIRYDYSLDRDFDDTQYGGAPIASQITGIVIYKEITGTKETILSSQNPAVFETEPAELADLDIYWEASGKLDVSRFNATQILSWYNCYSFGNGVESDRIRDDFNAPVINKGVRVNAELQEPYSATRKSAGLIYSGLYNSLSGVNDTNQFTAAIKITKDLDPAYGSIQKLHTRDTNLLAFCEDKVFRILADKDALYNADGNVNLTSTNRVLGDASTFAGEFGISKNPESFASYGFRKYFTDKARGAVLRLSGDGLTEVSGKGMRDFLRDKMRNQTNPIFGAFDESTGSYNVSIGGESVSFKEDVDGWSTRLDYVPEFGVSLNSWYYTFNGGELWEHSNPIRSNFYGAQYDTTVTAVFNDGPSSIKHFKTLSYEGSAGWTAGMVTDQQDGEVDSWKKREGRYFNSIKGVLGAIDTSELSVQGIGNPLSFSAPGATQTVTFANALNVSLSVGDVIYKLVGSTPTVCGTVVSISGETVEFNTTSNSITSTLEFIFFAKDNRINTSGIIGYYGNLTMTATGGDAKELFAVNSEVFISSE